MDPNDPPSTPTAQAHAASPAVSTSGGGAEQRSTTTPTLNATPGTVVPAALFNPPGTPATDDGGESKRRRIARACDMCRKKKIKCDGKLPACTHCTNYKTECLFTIVEKKRNPPKGAKYIEGLENRLGRMESLLKLSGLLPDGDDNADLGDIERRLQESSKARSTLGRSSSESTAVTPNVSTPRSAADSPKDGKAGNGGEDVEALSEQLCSLVTDNSGETRFIGSSSGFSIFSPKGIQWVNEKTGDNSFQMMVSCQNQIREKHPCQADVLFSSCRGKRDTYQWPDGQEHDFPPKETAILLVNDYFLSFNNLFPLFHEPTFRILLEQQYGANPPKQSSWYSSFMVVLAIACRLRISVSRHHRDSEKSPHTHAAEAWSYFRNSVSVLTELLMKNTDLLTIQALIGMALFLQGTANPQPSFFLISAAVRIATTIGIHRRAHAFSLSPLEVEQRRRIFWVIYMLDKDSALRSGRPPCLNDDDCNVDLPEENPADGIGNLPLRQEKGNLNLFRCMAQFSIIESKCYMQLYSAKASKQSDGELLNTIGQLDQELEQWKDSIPAEFRPENEMYLSHRGPMVMHVVMLHFVYYNCLTTIHRLNARPLNPRVFSSAALCVAAARATVHLIKYLDPRDYPCIWLVMYYPVSALVTLFANILQNPQDQQARSDLRLMQAVVDFLQNVSKDDKTTANEDDGSVVRMLAVCGEFLRIAGVVLDKSEKEGHGRRKRRAEDPAQSSRIAPRHPRPVNTAPTTQANQTASQQTSTPPVTQGEPMNVDPQELYNNNNTNSGNNDLGSPFSGGDGMNWAFNDFDGPKSSSATPPMTVENFQNMPMLSANSFEQPFVPQDFWQMPMTFEWDLMADVQTNDEATWGGAGLNNNYHM